MDHTIQIDPNSPARSWDKKSQKARRNLVKISDDAAYIMERISMRRVLRHQDGKLSWVLQHWEPGRPPSYPDAPLEDPHLKMAAFWELRHANLIYRLTEEGEPPVSKRFGKPGDGWRGGWKESGLDGRNCELFVCMM